MIIFDRFTKNLSTKNFIAGQAGQSTLREVLDYVRLMEGWAIRKLSQVDFFCGDIYVKHRKGGIRSAYVVDDKGSRRSVALPRGSINSKISRALSHILRQDNTSTIEERIVCYDGRHRPR